MVNLAWRREGGREGRERILVQTFCTRICIHCTPAAIDIITRGAHAGTWGAGTVRWGGHGAAGLNEK